MLAVIGDGWITKYFFMKINLSDRIIAYLALISGLSISAVAIYYSVAGLVSIFAAAVIPITVMGIVLEVGKLAATVWLKQNWMVAPRFLKTYLMIAIAVLMLITSMGIFGYLSKAHLDQAVPTGDVAAKVSLLDEKIKTERDNIETARTAIKQMDAQVEARLSRSDDEKGAERAVQIRRQQQTERGRLQKDIAEAQARIAKLNEERAPIASELRKVEAEVGPIKYIAALIYGDNPDQNLLESAVRWVIIIIVFVFDPLAVILLLASQYSFAWFRRQEEDDGMREEYDFSQGVTGPVISEEPAPEEPAPEEPAPEEPIAAWPFPAAKESEDEFKFLAEDKDLYPEGKTWEDDKDKEVKITPETHAYLFKPWVSKVPGVDPVGPLVYHPEKDEEKEDESDDDELDHPDDTAEIKAAKTSWKQDHPNDSLKRHRRLFEQGLIDKLPWDEYLKPQADFGDDDAAAEAAKWAAEQLEAKKKDSELDRTRRQTAGKENQGSIANYEQNAEQNESTLWKKIQDARK